MADEKTAIMYAFIIIILLSSGILNQSDKKKDKVIPIKKNTSPIKIRVKKPVLMILFNRFLLSKCDDIALVKGRLIPKSVNAKNPIIEEAVNQNPYSVVDVNFKIIGTVNKLMDIIINCPEKSEMKPNNAR